MKRLERLDTPWGRAYVLAGDPIKFLPSVTTVLSLVSCTYLKDIEDNIGKERLIEISRKAALRGTAMHKFLENYVICLQKTGEPEKCLLYTQRKSTDELLESIEKPLVDIGRSLFYNMYHDGIFKLVKKILLTEGFLYSEKFLFAGTTDFVFQDVEGKIVVADFKSASAQKYGEVILKYELQGAAYALAFEEIYNIKVDRIEIWISHPDGLQRLTTEGEVLEERKLEFIKYANTYYEMWEVEKIEQYYLEQKNKSI